jgi:deoxyribonuclease-4
VAGGLHHALEDARRHRAGAVQIFTRNNNRWAAKPLADEEIAAWKEALVRTPVETLVHDSYLINLASADPALYRKSVDAFHAEAERCAALGIERLVFHPGAHLGEGESRGLRRVARALDTVRDRLGHRRVRFVLENTAGQGTNLGWRFEHLAEVFERVEDPAGLGVCLDTCHLLAAGHDLRTPEGYRAVFAEFDRVVGLRHVVAFHLNDSKRELGSRVDRHENIGKGYLGNVAFRMLLTDGRFHDVPKVLETPKKDDGDRRNLALLRRLARLPRPA